jgi:hypothetical protein
LNNKGCTETLSSKTFIIICYEKQAYDSSKKQVTEKSLIIQAAFKQAVTDDLDKKSRLGQYAVLWRNNQIYLQGSDAPETSRK